MRLKCLGSYALQPKCFGSLKFLVAVPLSKLYRPGIRLALSDLVFNIVMLSVLNAKCNIALARRQNFAAICIHLPRHVVVHGRGLSMTSS